jgi:DNA-binding MarR family transcriptional regulator
MTQPSPDGYGRVERELAILLRRAHGTSGEPWCDAHGDLLAIAYVFLARLHDLGDARACDLSDYFGIDNGALSRQLRLLKELQLVTAQTDTADRRSHRLCLRPGGRQLLAKERQARYRLIGDLGV